MFEEQIKECDDKIVILKRLKRKYESEQRIAQREHDARIRKLFNAHLKYKYCLVIDQLIQRGTLDEDLNLLVYGQNGLEKKIKLS